MPQSLSQVILHIVFSTKARHPWLDPAIRPRMHAYLATVCRDCGCEAPASEVSPITFTSPQGWPAGLANLTSWRRSRKPPRHGSKCKGRSTLHSFGREVMEIFRSATVNLTILC